MNNSTEKLAGITFYAVLVLLSLVWSVGAIGKGIWQLSQSQVDAKNQEHFADFASVPNVTSGV